MAGILPPREDKGSGRANGGLASESANTRAPKRVAVEMGERQQGEQCGNKVIEFIWKRWGPRVLSASILRSQ